MSIHSKRDGIKILTLSFFLFLITFSTIIKSQESVTPPNSAYVVTICGNHECAFPEDRIVCPEDCDPNYKKNETEINNKINASITPLPVFVYAVIILLVLLIILLLIIYKMNRSIPIK